MNIKAVYDDFHKFLVSIGVVLIFAGIYVLISQNVELSSITPVEIINTSPGVLGVILIIIGIVIWNKKQRIVDISNNLQFINTLFKETSNKNKKKALLKEKEKLVTEGLFILTKFKKYKR